MIDNLDKSFLRLKTSFADAKYELLQDSEFVYKENIVLNPTKIYTQISNSESSIAFDDSYIVELVDCNDNALLDITNLVFINEFQDNKGIYQIAFEIAPIEQDFYGEHLFLRFTHTGSTLKLWSNPILVTEHYKTFRLEYKNYNYYEGISYDIANVYQSIDLVGYIDIPSTKETVKIYTQLNGDIRNSRPIQAIEYTFNIDFIDSFTFTRLSTALNSELVYINGVRFIKSENVQSDGREGKANYFPTMFKGQFVETDKLNLGYQIAPPFTYVTLAPLGIYTLASFPFTISTSDFNKPIQSVSYLELYNYDTDTFVQNIPYSVSDVSIDLDFTAISLVNGNYFIKTLLTSELGQVLEITYKDIWKFTIDNGHYNKTQYNNSQYFTD
jgi:hypothetical protein